METLYRAGLSNAVSATVLALFVACLSRVLVRRPAVLHCLWLLVLLKLVTPPLYDVSIPWPQSSIAASEAFLVTFDVRSESDSGMAQSFLADQGTLDVVAESPLAVERVAGEPALDGRAVSASANWMRLACLIWIGGIVTTLAVSIGRISRFQRLLRDARPASDDTQAWVDDLAVNMGLARSPSVLWTDGKLPPLVWYLGRRPQMIIPRALWKGLDEDQRSTLIIHELAHLCRGDHLVRIFELVVTALYWWHPLVWWARQALRDVEEQCCDAWVVWSCPDAAKSYAETLLETLDFLNQSDLSEPLLASGFGKVHHLRKRLTMIMSGTTPRLVGLSGTLGSLGLAALLLPVNPTWAQKPDDRQEVRVIVKSDGDSAESFSIVEDDAATAVATSTSTIEGGKGGEFKFEFKTDDSDAITVDGSVDEAIKKVKEQLDAIGKEGHPSDKLIAKKKALEHVVSELEKISKNDNEKATKTFGDKLKAEKQLRKVIVQMDDKARKLSDEQKAAIEKAADRVKKLSEELRTKQKELVEARTQLAKLSAPRLRTTGGSGLASPDKEKLKLDVRVRELNPAIKALERRVEVKRDGDPGQKRIDDLEKKLEKLLDEVASLKKDRAK